MPFDFADIAEQVLESAVEVDSGDWAGTGFFIAPNCSVVTARHIVEVGVTDRLAASITVKLQSGQVVPFQVDYDVEVKDFVVLRPNRSINCKELPLSATSPRLGEAVLLVGHPNLDSETSLGVIPGRVINTGTTDWAVDFLILALGAPGISGSPILNANGQAVGLIWGHWAYELDNDGNWIFSDIVLAGVEVSKHLR